MVHPLAFCTHLRVTLAQRISFLQRHIPEFVSRVLLCYGTQTHSSRDGFASARCWCSVHLFADVICVGPGFAAIIDPFLTLLIDICEENWYGRLAHWIVTPIYLLAFVRVRGDCFKLYQWFLVKEGSGAWGVIVTIFIIRA